MARYMKRAEYALDDGEYGMQHYLNILRETPCILVAERRSSASKWGAQLRRNTTVKLATAAFRSLSL
jgi:hypothetical protein